MAGGKSWADMNEWLKLRSGGRLAKYGHPRRGPEGRSRPEPLAEKRLRNSALEKLPKVRSVRSGLAPSYFYPARCILSAALDHQMKEVGIAPKLPAGEAGVEHRVRR